MFGELIGNFKITERLGRGAMGEVYAAEQTSIGTKAAIKLLRPELSEDRQQVQRFFNEAVAVSKIKHAGIVKIFDVGFHANGQAYLLMELLEGETLASRLAKTPKLPIARVYDIVRQIATILDATHTAGIVHRDLKPDNVFLVPDAEYAGERVKLLDFGVAKLANATTITGTGGSLGTPAYMAPEQWKNSKTVDARADIYSLGCVAFQMASGRPPFLAESVGEACLMHMATEPPSVRTIMGDVPLTFDALLTRMLAKEPGDRPSLRELIDAIDGRAQVGRSSKRVLGPSPIESGDTVDAMPVARTKQTTKKSRAPIWLALGAVVVIGGGVAAYFALANKPPSKAAAVVTVDAGPPAGDAATLAAPSNGIHSIDELLAAEKKLVVKGDLTPLFTVDAFGYGPSAGDIPNDGKKVAASWRYDIGTGAKSVVAKQESSGSEGDIAWIYQDLVVGDHRHGVSQVAMLANGEWHVRMLHRSKAIADKEAMRLAGEDELPEPAPLAADDHGDAELARKMTAMFSSRDAFVAAISDRPDAINIGSALSEMVVGGAKIKKTFVNWTLQLTTVGEPIVVRLTPRAVIMAQNVELASKAVREGFRVTALTLDDKIVLVHWSIADPVDDER